MIRNFRKNKITINTFSNGCLGSHNDEERSEMRYVMRIAISSESSKLWTQLALLRKYVCWSVCLSPPQNQVCLWSRYSGLLIVLWLSDREQIDLDENLDKTDLVFSLFFTAWRQNPSQQNPEKRRDVKLKSCLKLFWCFGITKWINYNDGCSIRISNQTRLPAEFKHINKRRKRN